MTTTTGSAMSLHCLQGASPPAGVVTGWSGFLSLPPSAKESIWTLLGPIMTQPAVPAEEMINDFCRQHELDPTGMRAVIEACGGLLQKAAALNLGAIQLRQDLVALSGGENDGIDIIATRFEAIKDRLRERILLETLSDHGKVLIGLNWRVDTLSASHRGTQLNSPVIFLTMNYRDGHEINRVTLQLTPDALNDLKNFCVQFSS